MSELKAAVQRCVWRVVDDSDCIQSATITGSFLQSKTVNAFSDIDVVLILDTLNITTFDRLCERFQGALTPIFEVNGLGLKVNPTLGPLKFNTPSTAVLHLMLYSEDEHVDHAIQSPFTVFDWQRSECYRKCHMADVYPVFALQPKHFFGARRSAAEYLRDFSAGVISYRELICDTDGCQQVTKTKPMGERDRIEFAYHIMRFLMQNLLKLVARANTVTEEGELLDAFFEVFPDDADTISPFFQTVHEQKRKGKSKPIAGLEAHLVDFVHAFESQFRRAFYEEATRHVAFRHEATALNQGCGQKTIFVGRQDPEILHPPPSSLAALEQALGELAPKAGYISPLVRSRQSYALLEHACSLPAPVVDERLTEIDYGACDGLTVAQAQKQYAELFEAWGRGDDPVFPGGECSHDVHERIRAFVNGVWCQDTRSAVCTHNVVLRCLVGHTLSVPREQWYRLRIPHMTPIGFIQTKRFGSFIDLDESVERCIFSDFISQENRSCKL